MNFFIKGKMNKQIIDDFHKLWYDSRVWNKISWHGIRLQKCPMDLHVYQELIWEIKPDLIIETGTLNGGSALYLAEVSQIFGINSKIITIDVVSHDSFPRHDNIAYITGSSIDNNIVNKVKEYASYHNQIMVILDSDHSMEHVYKELEIYSPLVTKNSYIIVEDTNIGGNPVRPKNGPGPMGAVKRFMENKFGSTNFIIDGNCEKHYMTQNPSGYLKRIN
jgi:cephalosporin hydroxylase